MTAAMVIGGISASVEQGETFYDVLGVPETATAEDIKRAYYRLVRQHRSDDNLEAYQKFQDAGKTLNDPRRRREYDQLRDAGRRVQVLSDQAVAAVDKDPQKAFGLLKAAVALAPDAPRPRLLLAHVLTRLNDFAGAEKQYRRLLDEYPGDENLHYRFSRCLFVQERYDDAERELCLALRLNPRYYDAHLLLARLFEKTGQYGPAIFSLERAIENDDVEDYADFDALLRLLVLHLRMENGSEAERTARRIVSILPAPGEDDETKQCERATTRMIARVRELVKEEQYTAARAVAALGGRLPNATPEAAATFAGLSREMRLVVEAKHIQDDAHIPNELKRMAEGLYLNRRLPEIERQARRREFADALHSAVSTEAKRVQSLVEYIRREYPVLFADHSAVFAEATLRAARRLEIEQENDTLMASAAQSAAQSAEAFQEADPGEAAAAAKTRRGILGWLRNGKK